MAVGTTLQRIFLSVLALIPWGALAGSTLIRGEAIEYKWKDGDMIWYAPRTSQPDQTIYDLCNEQFSKDVNWKVMEQRMWSPPCILQPKFEAPWIKAFLVEKNKLRSLAEAQGGVLPEKQISNAQLESKETEIVAKYEKHCPSGFKLTVVVKRGSEESFAQVVECLGRSALSCKPGYYSKVYGVSCASQAGVCKEGTMHPEGGLCLSCYHGGEIDLSPRRTSTTCAATETGGCANEYYCKVAIKTE